MELELNGRVVFANGVAASGVEVRVFDRDAPGKVDDDLTISPGLSDSRGQFTVRYDPARYLDFASLPFLGLRRPGSPPGGQPVIRLPDLTDVLAPYLQFTYTIDGKQHTHTAALVPFQTHYRLPESIPISFRPSRDGFRFRNAFKGYMLPFSIPFLPETKVSSVYGLCGGMSSAACDFILAGRQPPQADNVPRSGTRLHRYLFRRAIDTFAMGESILRFARWMALPDDGLNGTYRLTAESFDQVREQLANHQLVVLGLVLDRGSSLQEIARKVWNNHQVLAYGCLSHPDGPADLQVYDPNYPGDDTITIYTERVQVGEEDGRPVYGLRCKQKRGGQDLQLVRGFFPMPYEPVEPPEF